MSSKMDVLKKAFDKNQSEWKEYEADCNAFFGEFKQQLANYLNCEAKDIVRVSLPEDFGTDNCRKIAANRRMWLDNEANWHFLIRIVLEWIPPIDGVTYREKENKWLQLPFTVKLQDNESISVVVSPEGREIVVSENDYSELVDFTYTWLKNFLETEFQDFLNGKQTQKSSLGFSTSED